MGQEKVRKKSFKSQEKFRKFWNFVKSQEKFNQSAESAWYLKLNLKMLSAVNKCMVMAVFWSLVRPFIEYVLKVTIKIIFHHSKNVCKIYKLSILMAVTGGGGHTKSYVLLFIGQEKLEFSQENVRKFDRVMCGNPVVMWVENVYHMMHTRCYSMMWYATNHSINLRISHWTWMTLVYGI